MALGRSPRFIAILVLVTMLGPLTMQMFLPSLPAVQREFSASAGLVQLTITLAMVAIGFATLIFGPLADRFGRKPVLLAGLAIFLAGSAAGALAESVTVLIVARIFQAGGSSAGIVLARAIARDVYGFELAIRVISYLTMTMVLAPMLAPAIGGALTDTLGWRWVFWFMAAVGIVAVLGVWRALAETHTPGKAAGWRGLVEGSRRLAVNRRFLGYALISTSAIALFFVFVAAAPYLVVGTLQRPASDYGLWFIPVAGLFIAGTFLSTRLLDRIGPDRLIRIGVLSTLALVVASAPLYFVLPLGMPLLFGPVIVVSFVQGLIIPNCQASAINVDPRYAGAASGLTGFIQMAFSAVLAQLVAELADGSARPMILFMTMAALGGALCLAMIRRREETPQSPPPAQPL